MKRLEKFRPALLSIDLGSTHIKAGVFTPSGEVVGMAVVENVQHLDEHGYPVFDPQEMWHSSLQAAQRALQGDAGGLTGERHGPPLRVLGVGLTGMAESGLLVERGSGEALTPVLPWFDRRAEAQVQRLAQMSGGAQEQGGFVAPANTGAAAGSFAPDAVLRFRQHGVRPSYKSSLAKLLWIKDHAPEKLANGVWLGAPEYIAYRLCGALATDYSLAGRTCAFRIDEFRWDYEWLAELGLPVDIFPQALPAGTPLGSIGENDDTPRGYLTTDTRFFPAGPPGAQTDIHAAPSGAQPDLPAGLGGARTAIPSALLGAQVVIAGHDHVCAALAAGLLHGGVGGGLVYDSLGTAEALVGAFPQRALNEHDHRSGFSFGLHVAPGFCYWMGGINAAGGSLEWLRGILGDPKISYRELERLLDGAPDAPGELLYLPFLNGRGAPNRDPQARAAFIGLSAAHGRGHLARAVLEGTALELACILERARRELGVSTEMLAAAGGGVYNRRWMQIRADVTGCRIHVLPQAEAALLGAAALAGVGCGVFESLEQAGQVLASAASPATGANAYPGATGVEYLPDADKHAAYQLQIIKYQWLVAAMLTTP